MISLRAHLNIQQSPTNSNMKTNQINPLKTLQLLFYATTYVYLNAFKIVITVWTL